MNPLDTWHQHNQAYLSAALEWLRLKLVFLASRNNRPVPGPLYDDAPDHSAELASDPPSKQEAEQAKTDNGRNPMVTRAEIQDAAEKMAAAAAADPLPAMELANRIFGLTPFEQEVLLLCAAMELDTRIPALCAIAQDDPQRPYPTFALAMVLFDAPAWEAVSPERPLRFWRMIEIRQNGSQPLVAGALRIDERIVAYLKGLNYMDERLTPYLAPFEVDGREVELPASQQDSVDQASRHLLQACEPGNSLHIQLIGPDPLSKQMVAQQAGMVGRLVLYRLPAAMLPPQAGELETLSRLWRREQILMPVALYIDAHDYDPQAVTDGHASPLQRFLARIQGAVFIGTRDLQPGLGPLTATVEVDKPTPMEQKSAWDMALGGQADGTPALLAGQFNLNVAAIDQIIRLSAAKATDTGELRQDAIWDECLTCTRPRLDLLAQRLTPKACWEDIVLATETELLIRQISDQVKHRSQVYDDWGFRLKMNRGLGISALFSGESGTGKTMAAEVIANALKLNLYRIDLSQVVSKYIGETEKNLSRLFDAAEDGGAILFFDEADSLFGKRSEVKDSHDRYANIEINYLLQRMESYSGLAILATNMKSALDSAFLRRLRFIVNFPFPDQAQRKAIWARVFPSRTKKASEVQQNYDYLARLHLTGGSIHNVALNAAFMAARSGTAVTMPLILAAAQSELRKLDRPVSASHLRWKTPGKVVA